MIGSGRTVRLHRVDGVDGAEIVVDGFVDQIARFAQFFQREFREGAPRFDSLANESSDDPVRGALRDAATNKVFHKARRVKVSLVETRGDRFALEFHTGDDRRGEREGDRNRVEGIKDRLFIFLKIAVVRKRNSLRKDEERLQVADDARESVPERPD